VHEIAAAACLRIVRFHRRIQNHPGEWDRRLFTCCFPKGSIEQISGDVLAVNQGTLYPVLLKLEQEGAIASEWGASENNRRARFYRLTREGRKQLQAETQGWEQTSAIIARFFDVKAEDLS
jgi:transcriptional regulator